MTLAPVGLGMSNNDVLPAHKIAKPGKNHNPIAIVSAYEGRRGDGAS